MRLRFLVTVFIALGLFSAWETPTRAQKRPTLPSQQNPSVTSTATVPVETLPPVDVAQLRTKDQKQNDRITPYRYGTVVDTNYRPDQDGTWEQLPSNDWIWRLRIQSKNAVSLSLGFSPFKLPEKASLYVYDPQGTLIRGPYTQADATNGQHWTPLVHGEEIIVELKVPADQRQALNLVIGSVVHGYRSLRPSAEAKDGSCNLDVACEEADPWRKQVRSVGRYTFVDREGFASACSGSLINNKPRISRSLFLTAEHCVTGPDVANTMTFYWNYQNPICRTQGTANNAAKPDDDLDDQTSTGAVLLARYGRVHEVDSIAGKPDLTLVEVDDVIPKEYNLYLSGWNWEDAPTSRSTTIHHPAGDAKRISFDEDPSSITGYLEDNGGNTHLRIGNWETGTTEGGSSGGPLYNSNQRVVGVLSGGKAFCSGGVDDNNRPDWYGRLAAGFTKGDFEGRTFQDVLDPNNTGEKSIGGQDLVAPPGVSDLNVVNVTATSATLRWDAPEDDNSAPPPIEYDLRLRPKFPIETTSEFENARRINNVPSPGPPGTVQEITIDLNPDTSYYFAVRTLDTNKNASLFTASEDASPVTALRITRKPGPNPTTGPMKFGFSVAKTQSVQVDLFDTMGRRVRTLFDDTVQPFRQQTVSARFSSLSSGLYFLRIRGPSTIRTEKIVVTR